MSKATVTVPLLKSQAQNIQSKAEEPEQVTEYVDKLLSAIGFGLFQVIAFLLAEMTCLASVSEVLTFSFVSIEVTKHWNITNLEYASLPASTAIANIIGVLIYGLWADRFGRKWSYVASLFNIGLFVAVSAFAPNFATFAILRNLASIGIGGALTIKIPILMEFLSVRYRGTVATATGLLEGFAKCAVAGLAWWLVPQYSNGWRYFILASSVPSFVVGIAVACFFESPRYLVTHGKPEQAWKVFSAMAFINRKKLDAIVEKKEFLQKMSELGKKKSEKSIFLKFATIFNKHYLRRTLCFVMIFSITYNVAYNTTLFLPNYLNSLQLDPYFITLIGLASEIPGRALIPIIVEWPEFGRRNTQRIFFLMTIIFFLLFAFIRSEVATPVFIVLVYFSFVPSAGLNTAYTSESYPTEIRILAIGFFSITESLNQVWLPFVSGYATDVAHKYVWLLPTCLAGVMLIPFIAAMLQNHETRGKNLQDVI